MENKERLRYIAERMGLKLVEYDRDHTPSCKILNISKPGRQHVKEILQRNLESVVGKNYKNKL